MGNCNGKVYLDAITYVGKLVVNRFTGGVDRVVEVADTGAAVVNEVEAEPEEESDEVV